jgi:hypothetical protein
LTRSCDSAHIWFPSASLDCSCTHDCGINEKTATNQSVGQSKQKVHSWQSKQKKKWGPEIIHPLKNKYMYFRFRKPFQSLDKLEIILYSNMYDNIVIIDISQ